MIKNSQLDSVGTLTPEDLLMISQLVNDTDFKSFKVTLEVLKKFLGDITVVDVGVNLNTLVDPGVYILQGADTMQNSYNLNYPSGLAPGSKVLMIVSKESEPWAMITQTYMYAKLTSNPCPYSRGKSGSSAWAAWTQPVSQSTFDQRAVTQLNMSQGNTDLHNVGSGSASNIWSFIAPTDADNTPTIKTSPTKKPGVKLNLVIPNARPIIGTYKGNTFIADQDGRLYGNVDTTQLTDKDNPKGVDWIEFIGIHLKDKETLSTLSAQPSSAATVYAVNKIIGILRNINVLLSGNSIAKTATYEDDGQQIVAGADPTWIGFLILPADASGKLYIKSADETIAVLFDNDTGEQVTGATLTGSIDMVNRGNTPETAVQYGACTIKVKGLKAGAVNLIAATDAGFANVVGTMEIVIKAAS